MMDTDQMNSSVDILTYQNASEERKWDRLAFRLPREDLLEDIAWRKVQVLYKEGRIDVRKLDWLTA